jgi:hypothetical protein
LAESSGDGLVAQIERAIKQDSFLARDAGDLLYVFEGGRYAATGERFIAHATRRYLEAHGQTKSWSVELASRIAQYNSR